MAREYNTQIIESVSVRRRRLRDALLFGADRARNSLDEGLGKLFAGVALAAVICACCVGWAFIDRELAKSDKPGPVVSPSPFASASTPTASLPTLLPSHRPGTPSPQPTASKPTTPPTSR